MPVYPLPGLEDCVLKPKVSCMRMSNNPIPLYISTYVLCSLILTWMHFNGSSSTKSVALMKWRGSYATWRKPRKMGHPCWTLERIRMLHNLERWLTSRWVNAVMTFLSFVVSSPASRPSFSHGNVRTGLNWPQIQIHSVTSCVSFQATWVGRFFRAQTINQFLYFLYLIHFQFP